MRFLKGFLAYCASTYFDLSTLFITLPHNLIKDKLTYLFKQTSNTEGSLYLACNEKRALFHIKKGLCVTNNLKDLNCGNVRRFVMLSLIFGSIHL